jgi:hypothetical protein
MEISSERRRKYEMQPGENRKWRRKYLW